MREILFKAKRTDNGEWIEGYLYRLSEKHHPFIMLKDRLGESHEVDENTICQFTGLTDKNDNKIWENDVINVVYSNSAGEELYANGYIINDLRTTSIIGWLDYSNEIEITGNILDNPELMKEV